MVQFNCLFGYLLLLAKGTPSREILFGERKFPLTMAILIQNNVYFIGEIFGGNII